MHRWNLALIWRKNMRKTGSQGAHYKESPDDGAAEQKAKEVTKWEDGVGWICVGRETG